MNLLALIQEDGFAMKKVAGSHGGEYAGPCPFCGGNDRFRVWPEYKEGRYWCRGCENTGDAIQYLRDSQGLSYREACEKLGIKDLTGKYSLGRRRESRPIFTPKEAITPAAAWLAKATDFLRLARRDLWTDAGSSGRAFLHDRKGLSDETISQAGMGWNHADAYEDRNAWGLPSETRPDGRPKRVWIPAGLVIPCFMNERVIRLRIRRPDPGDGPRYVIIPGGSTNPMVWSAGMPVAVIVESELDGCLVHQEASDLVDVIALGSVTIRPDRMCHEILERSTSILISLDADAAGIKNSWKFWFKTYGEKVKRWPVPVGKDPSDAWQEGLNIRAWIMAGLAKERP